MHSLKLLFLQVIDKSRYSAKDSPLEREIDILTKVPYLKYKDRACTASRRLQSEVAKAGPTCTAQAKYAEFYYHDYLCGGLQVSHPNIVKLRSVFFTENTVFMVLDYASGGELLAR